MSTPSCKIPKSVIVQHTKELHPDTTIELFMTRGTRPKICVEQLTWHVNKQRCVRPTLCNEDVSVGQDDKGMVMYTPIIFLTLQKLSAMDERQLVDMFQDTRFDIDIQGGSGVQGIVQLHVRYLEVAFDLLKKTQGLKGIGTVPF